MSQRTLVSFDAFPLVCRRFEWMYFPKNTELPKKYKAKGLTEVEQQLNSEKMNTKEKSKFDEFLKSCLISESILNTAIEEGIEKTKTEAHDQKVDIILTLHLDGVGLSLLAKASKLSEEEVLKINKGRDLVLVNKQIKNNLHTIITQ